MTPTPHVIARVERAEPEFVNSRTLARLLCVSTRSLWRLAEFGVIPRPLRISARLVRWDRQAVLDAIRSQATPVRLVHVDRNDH